MIDGAMLIGAEARQADKRFTSVDPSTGKTLTPDFSSAGPDAVDAAAALAAEAFPTYAASMGSAVRRGGRSVAAWMSP